MPSVEVSGAGEVEVAGVALGLRQVARAPAQIRTTPIGTLMKRPQRQETQLVSMPPRTRPIAAAGAGDGAVEGDRAGALGALGEADREQGQGRGRGDRGADALQGAGGEQPGRRLGEAAEHRGDGEEGDAADEDLAAAEQVARRAPSSSRPPKASA